MNFCQNCNNSLDEDEKFCGKCGNPITSTPTIKSDFDKPSTLTAICVVLLKMKLGEKARIENIKARAEQGRILHQLDKKYIEKLAAYIKYEEPKEKPESITSPEEPQSTLTSETLENQTPHEKAIESKRRNFFRKTKEQDTILDQAKKTSKDPNKMRWGVAIGGAILLAFGLVLVISGSAAGFAGMCWGVPSSVRCYDNLGMIIMGWGMFWVGLIPTILGVRYVAKA